MYTPRTNSPYFEIRLSGFEVFYIHKHHKHHKHHQKNHLDNDSIISFSPLSPLLLSPPPSFS